MTSYFTDKLLVLTVFDSKHFIDTLNILEVENPDFECIHDVAQAVQEVVTSGLGGSSKSSRSRCSSRLSDQAVLCFLVILSTRLVGFKMILHTKFHHLKSRAVAIKSITITVLEFHSNAGEAMTQNQGF